MGRAEIGQGSARLLQVGEAFALPGHGRRHGRGDRSEEGDDRDACLLQRRDGPAQGVETLLRDGVAAAELRGIARDPRQGIGKARVGSGLAPGQDVAAVIGAVGAEAGALDDRLDAVERQPVLA
jgi:hypothetical protein